MQRNVLEYFERTCPRFPDKPAVVDRERTLSFSELRRQALALAGLIAQRTSQRSQPVAVFLPKEADAVVSFLGILYTGNCYAPMDVKSPGVRVKRILDHLNPVVVITKPALRQTLLDLGVSLERLLVLGEAPGCSVPAGAVIPSDVIDTDPAYIIHTSGSTGVPKGVVICHRGIIDYIDWARDCFGIDENCVIGNQAPFYFDNSTLDLYLCFACGATLHLIPEELFAFPVRLLEYVRRTALNFVFWVPSVLVNVANLKALDSVPCDGLKKILFAGEVMPARQLNYWRQRLPGALYANLYGPTEITVDCTFYIVDREFKDDEAVPIGVACRNTDVLVLNEQNRPAVVNEPGELCVRGSSLALGYWNNPEQTAKAFTQNPLNPHYPDLIYHTGDLVFRNERGEIMFIGRKDFQIKHQGYRIELGEIETAVLALPEIENACVLYHQGKKEITLFFESKVKLGPADIRPRLMERLPKYMFPTVFHQLDVLPRNANGKIDRPALTETWLKA